MWNKRKFVSVTSIIGLIGSCSSAYSLFVPWQIEWIVCFFIIRWKYQTKGKQLPCLLRFLDTFQVYFVYHCILEPFIKVMHLSRFTVKKTLVEGMYNIDHSFWWQFISRKRGRENEHILTTWVVNQARVCAWRNTYCFYSSSLCNTKREWETPKYRVYVCVMLVANRTPALWWKASVITINEQRLNMKRQRERD